MTSTLEERARDRPEDTGQLLQDPCHHHPLSPPLRVRKLGAVQDALWPADDVPQKVCASDGPDHSLTLWNTRVHHITTTSLLERAGVRPLVAYYDQRLLQWAGKMARMPLARMPRRMMTACVPHSRPRGLAKDVGPDAQRLPQEERCVDPPERVGGRRLRPRWAQRERTSHLVKGHEHALVVTSRAVLRQSANIADVRPSPPHPPVHPPAQPFCFTQCGYLCCRVSMLEKSVC